MNSIDEFFLSSMNLIDETIRSITSIDRSKMDIDRGGYRSSRPILPLWKVSVSTACATVSQSRANPAI